MVWSLSLLEMRRGVKIQRRRCRLKLWRTQSDILLSHSSAVNILSTVFWPWGYLEVRKEKGTCWKTKDEEGNCRGSLENGEGGRQRSSGHCYAIVFDFFEIWQFTVVFPADPCLRCFSSSVLVHCSFFFSQNTLCENWEEKVKGVRGVQTKWEGEMLGDASHTKGWRGQVGSRYGRDGGEWMF